MSKDEQRFWNKVTVRDSNDCWLWKGLLFSDGYGIFCCGGKNHRAHRWIYSRKTVWQLTIDIQVLHSCDVPACVNPNHLFLGDADDNSKDMVLKGRGLVGVDCHTAKLDEKKVLAIRQLANRGTRLDELNRIFPFVSREQIRFVIKGLSWQHVGGPIQHRDMRYLNGGRRVERV